ncbi:MAG: response regulator [Actinomycetota bacterium]
MGMTLLLVDDHDGFRRSARVTLEAEGFTVLGEAIDAASALASARALRPQLVLLDVRLPDRSGFAVAEELARDETPPIVVLISSVDRADLAGRLATSPARGFLPKHEFSGAALRNLIEEAS